MIRSVQNLASGGQELRGRNAWIADLALPRGSNRAAAVANKNARILWVLLPKDEAVTIPQAAMPRKQPDRAANRDQEIRDTLRNRSTGHRKDPV